MSSKAYLKLPEVCLRYGLSKSTIRRLVRDGKIPYFQPSGKGGLLLFPMDCIERSLHLNGGQAVNGAAEKSEKRRAGRRPKWLDDSTSG